MATISLCMIVKNEEDNIGKCLESVKDAVDEIVIVDTGSTDKTKEIAGQYTDKIYDFTWIDDFAAARNYAFSKGSQDFLMWLDADDVLYPEEAEKLVCLKVELDLLPEIDGVRFNYNLAPDEYGKPTLVYKRERLVRRTRGYQWVGFIHEYIAVYGRMMDYDISVTHTKTHGSPNRNLDIYTKKINEGVELSVRDQCYYAKELFYHNLLDDAISEFEKFLSRGGWIEDRLEIFVKLSQCYTAKKQYSKAREVLFSAFLEAVPRGEALYALGRTFQLEERYEEAVYWYVAVSHTPRPAGTAGFVFEEFWTWRPHLDACVCYWKLGKIDLAIEQNELAASYAPNHPSVLHNRLFFNSLQKENVN